MIEALVELLETKSKRESGGLALKLGVLAGTP